MKEAAGRALMSAATFAWQGAWLGALIAGGFAAAGGGAWVIVVALGAVLLGGCSASASAGACSEKTLRRSSMPSYGAA